MTSLYLFFMLNWCLSYNEITLFWTLFCKCCQKIPHKGIYLDKMLGLYLNVSGSIFIFPLFLKITLRLEGVCVCVCVCVRARACALSCVWLRNPMDLACQAPLSMGFSKWEYWSGLPFPSPGDLSNTGINPVSLASPVLEGDFFFFTSSATWEALS